VDRFQLFRLSLTPREADLFTPEPPPREAYLRTVFGQQQRFQHQGNPFVYVPSPEKPASYIVGQVGRPFVRLENLPPDKGFALAEHEGWRAAVLALDPTSHSDGQKLAFSVDDLLGTPSAVLRSFIKHLNHLDSDAPYHTEAEPIFSPRTFWAFAEEHKGEVTSLRFEFVTPNMFGSADSLSEELREFRHDERAQIVNINLRSQDGLNTDTPRVRAGVEYAGKGAGKILAFARGGRRYNSQNQVETTAIEETDEPLLMRALRHLHEILGR
jgi:hypothetical protein